MLSRAPYYFRLNNIKPLICLSTETKIHWRDRTTNARTNNSLISLGLDGNRRFIKTCLQSSEDNEIQGNQSCAKNNLKRFQLIVTH